MPHYIMHNAFTITDEAWIYLVHEIIYYEWFSQAIWSLRWLHMLNYLVWCIISVNYCRSCCEINLCAHCLNDWVSNLPLCLLLQEIPLSEILEVRPARDFSLVPAGTSPHCFEIMTGTMIYFVGEDPNTTPSPSSSESGLPISFTPCSVAPNSGVGREFAKGWETAIRQALMPVIFQDNPPAEGHTPHREWKVWYHMHNHESRAQ